MRVKCNCSFLARMKTWIYKLKIIKRIIFFATKAEHAVKQTQDHKNKYKRTNLTSLASSVK